jgi:hypothetical protein
MPGCGCQNAAANEYETRPRSNSDEWLLQSPGIKLAYQLLEAGKIDATELELLVQQDRLWHTGERITYNVENPMIVESSVDEVEAQVTDEDLGLGLNFESQCDPLSLEELLCPESLFVFRGKQQYNIETLYQYIYSTNTYADPTTRLEYTDQELQTISQLYQLTTNPSSMLTFPFVDLSISRHEKKGAAEQKRIRHSALNGVENILDSVVSEIRDCVSGLPMNQCQQDTFSRSICLTSQLFPCFDHSFAQLKDLSPENAANCLKIYIAQLKGHPKRPTKDPYRLLRPVIKHVQESLETIDGES